MSLYLGLQVLCFHFSFVSFPLSLLLQGLLKLLWIPGMTGLMDKHLVKRDEPQPDNNGFLIVTRPG
jgi:hypothetical protein